MIEIRIYGGVPLDPPASSLAEAEQRWQQALHARDPAAMASQRARQRKAKAFAMAAAATRPAK
jgi:hypothetical protein